MVRLHVVNDKIVQRTSLEQEVELMKEDIGVADIHRIDECRLLVQDEISIVGYS